MSPEHDMWSCFCDMFIVCFQAGPGNMSECVCNETDDSDNWWLCNVCGNSSGRLYVCVWRIQYVIFRQQKWGGHSCSMLLLLYVPGSDQTTRVEGAGGCPPGEPEPSRKNDLIGSMARFPRRLLEKAPGETSSLYCGDWFPIQNWTTIQTFVCCYWPSCQGHLT